MKRLIFFVFVFSFITGITCGQIQTKVDERFELTSIAFMLAGAPEYNQCGVRSWEPLSCVEINDFRIAPLRIRLESDSGFCAGALECKIKRDLFVGRFG